MPHTRAAHRARTHSLFLAPVMLAAVAASILITGFTPVRLWQALSAWAIAGAVWLATRRLRVAQATFDRIIEPLGQRPDGRPGVDTADQAAEREREALRVNRWPR